LLAIPFMGTEFLPPFNEGSATINILSVPGTSLDESNRIGTLAEELLLSVPEVVSTGRRTGRAELDEHAEGVHYGEIDVDFKPSERRREEILGEIREKLSQIPGVVLNIGQPISHRLDHLLSGVRAQIAIKLFGNELDVLRSKAGEIQSLLEKIPGVTDLQIEKQVLIPQIQIRADREKAKKYGIRVGALAEVLEAGSNGKVISQIIEGQRTFNVLLRFSDDARKDINAYRNILIDTPSGAKVPLSEVAEVNTALGPNVINHENVQRRIVISANTQGRDLGGVIEDIQKSLKEKLPLPSGYFITYGGQFESQQSATRMIALLSIFSLLLIFLVLYTHFHSARTVLQILLNIPLALIGSIAAILLTDRTISVASLIGFITLCGIASRNTIMMISHYIHLVQHEGEKFDKQMIIRGSLERLVPVLMTASTAALALIPLVLSAGEPGKEILYPVAIVILGGLTSSTLLDMIVTPAVFYRFGKVGLEAYLKAHEKNEKQQQETI
jgi:Cu/Ag efflux pump CusA